MKSYIELQEIVFNWLMNKHSQDSLFTFSVRQVASKGAELNYFIGTEKSEYFSTTFWSIQVNYPGSSSDLINLVFELNSDSYSYHIQFNQTRSPFNDQNRFALEFIKNIKEKVRNFRGFYENDPTNKIEYFHVGDAKAKYYTVSELFTEVEKDMTILLPIIDEELIRYKIENPEFKAEKISKGNFDLMISKLEKRRAKHAPLLSSSSQSVEVKDETPILSNIQPKIVQPLNQILFGPPGTGKTYNTINKAIKIVNPDFDLNQERKLIKNEYQRLVKEGQIVFTTFHQSMDYEDFIEGIKPFEPKIEGQAVNYRVENGIFKVLAKKAKENIELSTIKKEPKSITPFDSLFNLLIEKIETSLLDDPITTPNKKKEGYVINLATSFFSITGIIGSSIRMMTRTGNKLNTMTKPTLQLIYEDRENIEKYITGGMRTYYKALVEEMSKWHVEIERRSQNIDAKNYVLIIDEINRGNVSQIFGELITLIEDDKRLGNTEVLEVTLPYSKEKFGVPPNLYIIGTMNTADRSVEALDAALRRRFSFEEIQPKPEIIKIYGHAKDGMVGDIDLTNLLTTINKRLEVLLDKDHQIGHSYFMCVSNIEELKSAFQNRIIPLLQEYFFGDNGKIGLVLGIGFIIPEKKNNDKLFADFKSYDSTDFSERVIYKIENVANMEDLIFQAAIKSLLNN